MSDFDDYRREENMSESPLAFRMCPKKISDIAGQEHILGEGKLLRRMIEADRISSIILYGPPGCGKTTIAKVIAETTKSNFVQINATIAGKADMQDVIKSARDEKYTTGRKTILFVDEIHRFNKAQQDYLLPFVENGTVILIGATTENPYFEVNSALISRSNLFELYPVNKNDIKKVLYRAINDKTYGIINPNVHIDDEAVDFLSEVSNGDVRTALNALELAVSTTPKDDEFRVNIGMNEIENCVQKKRIRYGKNSSSHYDIVSAFIKSMRGSSPDATSFYLAEMLSAGEDIKFIARRIVICASEDVGNADPMALVVANNAMQAIEKIGMPEARIILAQAAIYVATAPKSNSCYLAINKGMKMVEESGMKPVPPHLQNLNYKMTDGLQHGTGYMYPHNYPGHFVIQEYMPEEIREMEFYIPSNEGYERKIKEDKRFNKGK